MIEEIVDNLVRIKQNFAKNYDGNAHIQEVIPINSSKEFPIDEENLAQLHTFAQKNPIYLNSFEKNILDIKCMVYEGDINCLLYTSPSPRDRSLSRMPSSA